MKTAIPPSDIPITDASQLLRPFQVIKTDEGVDLIADLYIPPGKPPFPAIVEITPYNARQLQKLGEIYATRGYLFVAVDARGRYRSDGKWQPMEHDQKDGHAVLQWVAGHHLCNGRIGTRGHSYCGFNQLLAAVDAPAALQAMVVCVAPGDPFTDVPFRSGAYDISDFMWLLSMSGRVCNDGTEYEDFGTNRFGADEYDENPYLEQTVEEQVEETQLKSYQEAIAYALASRPFKDMDLRLGIRLNQFRQWIRHWQLDEYWRQRSVLHRIVKTDVPTLHISGWWDSRNKGATLFYRNMREKAASLQNRQKQRLLLGAWNHAMQAPDCADLPSIEAAQIKRAALRDELNDEFAWFDQHLMDIAPGVSSASRVTLFITGLYQWFDYDDWPPGSSRATPYYLLSDKENSIGTLQSVVGGGTLPFSRYVFNPEQPTPFGPKEVLADKAPFDNGNLMDHRTDLLVFQTPVMGASLALVGEVSLVLYAQADVPDFDLCGKLLDVYPDGRAIYLADGIIRARFRESFQHPRIVQPDEIQCYQIDMWHIGHVLRTGHALRLEIASAAFGRFDVNPCTGRDLAEETHCQTANITIYHNREYPSHALLPICNDPRLTNEGV